MCSRPSLPPHSYLRRDIAVTTNNFAAEEAVRPAACIAGTSYFEKADSNGFTYAKMCRPW